MSAMRRRREDENGAQEVAELAALADGTLAPERRAALEARVAASSELTDRLAEQQRAVTLMRSAADEVEAPAALRARIEAQRRGWRRDRAGCRRAHGKIPVICSRSASVTAARSIRRCRGARPE